jgi:hypothetical protein
MHICDCSILVAFTTAKHKPTDAAVHTARLYTVES